jgi:hypothetical protein
MSSPSKEPSSLEAIEKGSNNQDTVDSQAQLQQKVDELGMLQLNCSKQAHGKASMRLTCRPVLDSFQANLIAALYKLSKRELVDRMDRVVRKCPRVGKVIIALK